MTLPSSMDFAMYFNVLFFGMLGLGMFFGFLRGFKKSVFLFIVMLLFYALFFLTIDQVVGFLWTYENPMIGEQLAAYVSQDFASVTSIQGALATAIDVYVPAEYAVFANNAELIAFVSGVGMFVLKIVYTLVYFTVFLIIYRIFFFFIRIIFLPTRKNDKLRSKNRGLGAVFGLASAVLSVMVTLITLGGLISIADSMVSVIPTDLQQVEMPFERDHFYEASYELTPVALDLPIPPELTDALDLMTEMVDAYNSNMVVTAAYSVTVTDPLTSDSLPLNLYLFDSVLSFTYHDNIIAFRDELSVISETVGSLLGSEFMTTQNLSDITGEDIQMVFDTIAQSEMLTSLLPLAIDLGYEYAINTFEDLPALNLTTEELYAIDWANEISLIGDIAATAFTLLNDAGALGALSGEEVDLTTITIDGDTVRDIFDSLASSQLVTLAAYVAVVPVLEMVGGTVQAVVTIPEDIEWDKELIAFGEIIGSILDTGITFDALSSQDPLVLVQALASLDFTVLLESKIIVQALVNVFQGAIDIQDLDFLVIPDDIVWFDQYDEDGNLIQAGELRNILLAVNQVAIIAQEIDFTNLENLTPSQISLLSDEAIDSLFESRVLVASLSQLLLSYATSPDLGMTLIVPDSVFDESGYILKTEFVALASSLKLVVEQLACDEGDTACEDAGGFDISKALTLSDEDIDTLLSSDIIAATVGYMVLGLGNTPDAVVLVIPDSATDVIQVNSEDMDVVSRDEIKAVFSSISLLEITSMDNLSIIDLDTLGVLATEADSTVLDLDKANTLFSSKILHATISYFLLELSRGDGAILSVPYVSEDLVEIRYNEGSDEFISIDELNAILQAILILDIQSFDSMDSFDLSVVSDHAATILESTILQATISTQLFDLGGDLLSVPYVDEDENPVRFTVTDGTHPFEYISKAELTSVFEALGVLGITDVNSFDGNVDLATISEGDNLSKLLSSAILHATVSTQVLDLAGDGLIQIPYFAEDGDTEIRKTVGEVGFETEYIIKAEINAVFDALQVLGINDVTTFDGNVDLSVLSQEGNIDILLSSSVIQATISKQVLDLVVDGFIQVPYVAEDNITLIRKTVGEVGGQTEYIVKVEISAVFDALDVLGISDVTTFNGNIDLSLLTQDNNADILLSSSIIQATISKQVLDLDANGTLSVPTVAEDGTTLIRTTVGEIGGQTEYIVKDEISAIFDALDILGINDVTTFSGTVDLSLITEGDNASILLSSSTIQATISQQLLDLNTSGTINVPELKEDNLTPLIVTVGEVGDETTYVIKSELEAVFDALDVLGITDVESFSGSVDLSLLSIPGNIDILLSSSIIQATISKQIIDLEGDGTLVVPYVKEDGVTLIRVMTGTLPNQTEYLVKSEISSIIDALNILGITDVATFNGSVDLSVITQGDNAQTLLMSSVIQATVTKQILDLGVDGTLEVPYYQEDGITLIRVTVGEVGQETEYLVKTELEAIFNALDVLGLTDLETFSGTVSLSTLAEGDNATTVLASSVIQATVSKQVIDLDTSDTIQVPYFKDDNASQIRLLVGALETETEYVLSTELNNLIHAMDLLGINDVETFDGSVDISVFYDEINRDVLLSSAIMQATISKQLLDLGPATLVVPYQDSLTVDVRLLTGPLGDETEYVSKAEIGAIFEGLELLGITDVTAFDGTIDLTDFYIQGNRDILLSSACMHATISKQLVDLGSAALVVPYVSSDDATDIRVLVGPLGNETEFVIKSEIDAIFESLEILGITDINSFSGDIDISLFYDQTNRDVLLASASLHATMSKQLLDLGSDALVVPYEQENDLTMVRVTVGEIGTQTEYVVKDEIDAIFEGLQILGITDVTTFDGSIDISLFYEQSNRDILLASASMQATITKQLLDLGSATLVVPMADEDTTAVRLTVGELGQQTEYITKTEISAMFEALELLGLTDINSFNGSLDLTLIYGDANQTILLASASMQATITKQIDDLGSTILLVPLTDVDSVSIQDTIVGTHFIFKTELKAIINSLEILGITDINSFDGSVDLTNLFDDTNQNTLLSSASMHATITKQIDDLGASVLLVPHTDVDSTVIEDTIGVTHFIFKNEIKAIINSLDILGITDITTFDGSVNLTNLFDDTNQNTLLSSASMHATITKQIDDLGSAVLLVPHTDVDSNVIEGTVSLTHFIYKNEIKAIINSLEILGITDITAFDGSVSLTNLFNDLNQNILLSSASMHATITKQIDDLGSAVLLVPHTDVDSTVVEDTIGLTHFIFKGEIKAIINSLDILEINDITAFTGAVSLTNLFNEANQDILLTSASMHATITKQIDDLGSAVLLVPHEDINTNVVEGTVSLTHFIYKDEVKAIINALEILGVTDITNFSGGFDISALALSSDQDILLTSASMHATISQTLFDLGDTVLIVPTYTQDGEIEANLVQKQVSSTDFIFKAEIKHLIDAFIIMGYSDLNSFGASIDSSKFFDNPDTLLLSASIQATLSDKLINGTSGNLIVPNANFANTYTIRIVQSDVTYVEVDEIKAILDALDLLGLTDFSAISITPANVFAADFDTLLISYSMQATISDTLLDGALDDSAAAGCGSLIVPNFFRETLNVGLASSTQIEKVELKKLLTGLQTLGVSDFGGSISASVVTGLSDAQLDTVLASGSMQVSVDNMLKGNTNINTEIPDLAQEDVFNMTDITTKEEIKAFIKATNILATGDISNIDFDVTIIAGLSASDRDIVLDSMIVRNMLTDELESMMLADDPFDLYWPANTSYMNDDPATFLSEAGINEVLTHYGLI